VSSTATTLLAVGDNVVDKYPQRGMYYPGGNAVNVAVHARRLGIPTAYIGALGNDQAGQVVLEALQTEGVDTARLRIADGANAFAVVEVVEGNRVFLQGDLGVSSFELTSDDFAAASTYGLVHTGDCSGMEAQLGDLAKAASRLSFDFSERPWDYVEEHAPLVSIATLSSPTGDVDAAVRTAERVRALGPLTVAVTLGADGAVVIDEESTTYRPSPPGPIVDTLGAGDAFIARLLVGLLHDEATDDLVDAATRYATSVCSSFGAFGYATPFDPVPTPHEPHHRAHRLDVS
jgi:fructoselysine 6-kinase